MSRSWREIQALRAEPTGKAADDEDRKKTFQAALRQAEDLAKAADDVSYATKPIPLFYALSQAGRAIAAARLQDQWALKGHGLKYEPAAGTSILNHTVEPQGRARPQGSTQTAFRGVSAAAGSPPLAGKAHLGALWAANPDLIGVPIRPELAQWPVALSHPLGSRAGSMGNAGAIGDPSQEQTTTGGKVRVAVDVAGETGKQVVQSLQAYPSLADAAPLTSDSVTERYTGPDEPIVRRSPNDGQPGVTVGRDAAEKMSLAAYWQLQDTLFSLTEVDHPSQTWPGDTYVGYALPAIAGGLSPRPLLLWWALLLGLSSLARYEPAAWTAALDLDASRLAADLPEVLDIAAERVPARILTCLKAM